jgi:AAA family ATP:ADP antiporter
MYAVALSFVVFFCVLAGYYVMRPLREQLSAAVGSTQLPWFYAATFVATLALTPVFAALVSRWPRPVVVPLVYAFFIACLLAFVPLFTVPGLLSPRALGAVFFVWVSVFSLFAASVFWSFVADIWDQRQARRLFPVIALGGTAGAITGPLITRSLVGLIGVAPLLVVAAALLGVAMVCVVLLGRWSRAHGMRREAIHEAAVGGGMFDGLRQVFADPYMRSMALLMLLGDCVGTINYALVTDYSGATFHDAVARTRFAANLDLSTNILQVLVQLTLTRWLLVRHGAAPAIAVWAVATVAV